MYKCIDCGGYIVEIGEYGADSCTCTELKLRDRIAALEKERDELKVALSTTRSIKELDRARREGYELACDYWIKWDDKTINVAREFRTYYEAIAAQQKDGQ